MMEEQPKKIESYSEIITLKEACKILHCHPNTLRNWDNNGALKAIRFGTRGDRRYRREDILHLINPSILD